MDIPSESIKGREYQISVQDISISKIKGFLIKIMNSKGIEI